MLVQVRNLRKDYSHGDRVIHVLRGIDLDVAEGEMVSVVGASGVGKSTLLHVLGTLDRPTSGSISFEGRELTKLSASELARFRGRHIGFVFQAHHLLPEFTALENVMLPALIQRVPPSRARKQALELLEAVGLADRVTHKPGQLSGGEQQRVALARALVMRPKLLLADEPTGNLDSKTGASVHELFFKVNAEYGTTIVLATHNQELAARVPRRLRMVDGLIVDESRPLEPAEDRTPGSVAAARETGEGNS